MLINNIKIKTRSSISIHFLKLSCSRKNWLLNECIDIKYWGIYSRYLAWCVLRQCENNSAIFRQFVESFHPICLCSIRRMISGKYKMCEKRWYLQGTRKTLTKELIWAIDADTPSEMLIYTVLRADTDAGHIERVTYPFRPIDTFTQAELIQGLIAYVHRGNGNNS